MDEPRVWGVGSGEGGGLSDRGAGLDGKGIMGMAVHRWFMWTQWGGGDCGPQGEDNR